MDAPENTVLAFVKAMSAGATHLETDVHASHDGAAVLSHDPDLSRVAGRGMQVDQLTIHELRRIDLGQGQTFVSLDEALDSLPDALFNIDVKSHAAIVPTARAIVAANALDRVLITSFSEKRRLATIAALPGVATSASSRQVARAIAGARLHLGGLVRSATDGIDAVQLPERYRSVTLVTAGTVAALHACGLEVHVWTVNDRADMQRLLDLGVDGLITDRADLAREVVDARS